MNKRSLIKYFVYLILSAFVSGLFFVMSLGCGLGAVEGTSCGGFAEVLAIPFNILLSVAYSFGLYPIDYDWLLLAPIIFVFILLIEKLIRLFRENKFGFDLKADENK